MLKEEVRLLKEILDLKGKIAELENKQPIPAPYPVYLCPSPTFLNVWYRTSVYPVPDESITIN